MSKYPEKVKIVEVGPRDGLQNEKEILSPEQKVHFIDLLSQSGLPVIESGFLVHPKWVPQLADTEAVYLRIQKKRGVAYPLLVPNQKGLERALQVGAKQIAVFTAASEMFNQKNINRTIQQSLEIIKTVVAEAKKSKMGVRGYVSTCFYCPYEGKILPVRVVPIVEDLLTMGIDEISLGDTLGAAVPTDVEPLLGSVLSKTPAEKVAVHFHDTRGTAIANIVKSLELGISIVDSSAGGLGGCPYAPGASGNVATEDVLYLLHTMGIHTGVDLQKVASASQFISKILNRELPSKYLQTCHLGNK